MLDDANIQKLRDILRGHTRVEIVGSQVAELIRHHFGQSLQVREYGFVNLREMLKKYVPELRVVGRSGVDVVYRWVDESKSSTSKPGIPDADLSVQQEVPTPWSAWATPGSGFDVVLCDGRPRCIPAGDEPRPLEVLLPGTTPVEHRAIAESFLAVHSDNPLPIREGLRHALELDDKQWWNAWVHALREERALHGAWLQYRLRELRLLLKQRLTNLALPEATQQSVMEAMIPPRRAAAKSGAKVDTARPEVRQESSDDLRSLVLEAVRRMDVEELRALRIPVGIILDIKAELARR